MDGRHPLQRGRETIARWLGPTVLASSGAVLCVATWRKWPQPFIDFGRELYVPWQITQGKQLYRDLAYFNGPLSPYLNALLMRLFGVQWTTLIVANILVLALIITVLHRLLVRIAARRAATTSCLTVLAAYGFSQFGPVGNNNLVAPYSHECSHGLLAGFAALWCMARWIESARRRWLVAAGVCIGLSLLTKTEIAAATGLGCLVAFGGSCAAHRRGVRRTLVDAGWLAAAAASPIALFVPLVGFGGVMTPWRALGQSRLFENSFLRSVMGIDRPVENLMAMARSAVLMTVTVVAALLAGRAAASVRGAAAFGWVIAATTTAAAALLLVNSGALIAQVRMLPLALVTILVWSAVSWSKCRDDAARAGSRILAGALAVFSIVMIAKMALNVVVYPYGFQLAMPATALTAAAMTGLIPRCLGAKGGAGVTGGAMSGLCIAFAVACVARSGAMYAKKVERVGSGGDAVVCNPRDALLTRTLLAVADTALRTDETVMLIPEGVIVNYLTRRTNPTPHYNFVPLEMAVAGEDRILADLQERPPDAVLEIPSFTPRVYGFDRFGVPGFGEGIMRWIVAHYDPAPSEGRVLGEASRIGVRLWRHRKSSFSDAGFSGGGDFEIRAARKSQSDRTPLPRGAGERPLHDQRSLSRRAGRRHAEVV